ncbi:hypothetical protein POV26_02255 [Aequorivita todarodis]|uniref:hypothetical protein n=1 Tax=Aequorivita todarodis TaxID=2036821 RepID=UPI00235045EA|nr:hypothetical protein [Aequorivita todarodis]MDC7999846.1 hypothetical protein [Aequorivita todarodis]
MKPSNSNNSHIISASKKLILLTFVTLAFFSCKNKEEKPNEVIVEEETVVEEAMPSLEIGCYTYNQNGNTVNLEITKNDNPVEGNLSYAFAEKDKNTGTFTGEFNDRKLIGTYTFQSEGKEGKRQVAFMLKDGQLVEGYGELNEDGTRRLRM